MPGSPAGFRPASIKRSEGGGKLPVGLKLHGRKIAIRFRREGDVLVARASGILTRESARALRQDCAEALAGRPAHVLVVDFTSVIFTLGPQCWQGVADDAVEFRGRVGESRVTPLVAYVVADNPEIEQIMRAYARASNGRDGVPRVIATSLDDALDWARHEAVSSALLASAALVRASVR